MEYMLFKQPKQDEQDPITLEDLDEKFKMCHKGVIGICAHNTNIMYKYEIETAYNLFVVKKQNCPYTRRKLTEYEVRKIDNRYRNYINWIKYVDDKKTPILNIPTKDILSGVSKIEDISYITKYSMCAEDFIKIFSDKLNDGKNITREKATDLIKNGSTDIIIRKSSVSGNKICEVFAISVEELGAVNHYGAVHIYGYAYSYLLNINQISNGSEKLPDKYNQFSVGNLSDNLFDFLGESNVQKMRKCFSSW